MKIQYASDLHLNIRGGKFKKIIKPVGDMLILAGDIGNPYQRIYSQFLDWCNLNFKYVILIPGNHEYHGSSVIESKRQLHNVCKKYNIILLDNSVFCVPDSDLIILGSTLWSYIPEDNSFEVLKNVNDFKYIKGLSLNAFNELHQKDKLWLKETIKKYSKRIIIVVTHHSPYPGLTSSPLNRTEPFVCAYASDCTDIMEGVDYWIYGHTHYNSTITHNKTIITSNQRGYPRENIGYKNDLFLKP